MIIPNFKPHLNLGEKFHINNKRIPKILNNIPNNNPLINIIEGSKFNESYLFNNLIIIPLSKLFLSLDCALIHLSSLSNIPSLDQSKTTPLLIPC